MRPVWWCGMPTLLRRGPRHLVTESRWRQMAGRGAAFIEIPYPDASLFFLNLFFSALAFSAGASRFECDPRSGQVSHSHTGGEGEPRTRCLRCRLWGLLCISFIYISTFGADELSRGITSIPPSMHILDLSVCEEERHLINRMWICSLSKEQRHGKDMGKSDIGRRWRLKEPADRGRFFKCILFEVVCGSASCRFDLPATRRFG